LVRTRWVASAIGDTDSGLSALCTLPSDDGPPTHATRVTLEAIALERSGTSAAVPSVVPEGSTDRPAAMSSDWEVFSLLLALATARAAADAPAIREATSQLAEWSETNSPASPGTDDLRCLVHRAEAEAALVEGDLDAAGDLLERVYRQATVAGLESQM